MFHAHNLRASFARLGQQLAVCLVALIASAAATIASAQDDFSFYPTTEYPIRQVAYVQPLPETQNNSPLTPSQLDFGNAYSNASASTQSSIESLPPGTISTNKSGLFSPPTGAAPCVNCAPSDCSDQWHSQVLPQGLIYQSYMAGAKEPRLGSFWNQNDVIGTTWDIALGGRAGLWRYGNDNPDWPEGWQLDIEGGVFPRLDPFGESTPLLSSDYRFGIPLTYGKGQWQFKCGYYHISSHLGDELMLLDPTVQRLNFVRDGIVFGTGYFFTPAFRLYGELGYAPSATGGAEPLEFQFGFDWAQARNTGIKGGPFLATNANLRQEVDYGGNFVVQFGWMWRQYARGSDFRIGGEYFYGKSDQFEFFTRTESRVGWGVWYDF
jgi:hypothetical protein